MGVQLIVVDVMRFGAQKFLWMVISIAAVMACSPKPSTDSADSAQTQYKAQIVATSRPLMLIAKEITQGIDDLSTVAASADSHDTALTPSELKRLRESDLVLWLGADAEPGLAEQLEGLSAADPQTWLSLPDSRAHKGEKDPHFWFSSAQVADYAEGLSDALSKMYPERASWYGGNLASFKQRLNQIDEQTTNMNGVKYLAAIDVYQSLEQQTGIEFDGALADHDQPIRPGRLQQAAKSGASCILASTASQPDALDRFDWIVIDELMRGVSSYTEGLNQAISLVRDCQKNKVEAQLK